MSEEENKRPNAGQWIAMIVLGICAAAIFILFLIHHAPWYKLEPRRNESSQVLARDPMTGETHYITVNEQD